MDIVAEIEAFVAKHEELSDSLFGDLAVNDRHLVRDLRAGRDLRMSTVGKIRAFMATYRPATEDRVDQGLAA